MHAGRSDGPAGERAGADLVASVAASHLHLRAGDYFLAASRRPSSCLRPGHRRDPVGYHARPDAGQVLPRGQALFRGPGPARPDAAPPFGAPAEAPCAHRDEVPPPAPDEAALDALHCGPSAPPLPGGEPGELPLLNAPVPGSRSAGPGEASPARGHGALRSRDPAPDGRRPPIAGAPRLSVAPHQAPRSPAAPGSRWQARVLVRPEDCRPYSPTGGSQRAGRGSR